MRCDEELGGSFNNFRQQDAMEYLNLLVRHLEQGTASAPLTEVGAECERPTAFELEAQANRTIEARVFKNDAIWRAKMGGYCKQVTSCAYPGCESESVKYEEVKASIQLSFLGVSEVIYVPHAPALKEPRQVPHVVAIKKDVTDLSTDNIRALIQAKTKDETLGPKVRVL